MKPVKDLALLRFSGKDAASFLHNQLTADIQALSDGASTFACLCQPKGRVIALLLIHRVDAESLIVLCHSSLAAMLKTYLQRFVFRDKVDIALDLSAAIQGLSSELVDSSGPSDQPPGLVKISPMMGLNYFVMTTDSTSPKAAQTAAAETESNEMLNPFRAAEIAAGVVWLDSVTSEQFLPQMLGYESIGALNFRKGCFPGQEVVARTRYLGKLKRVPWTGKVQDRLAVDALGAVSLSNPDNANNRPAEAKGVLVGQAMHADGTWQVFVVARPGGDVFDVTTLETENQGLSGEGHWLVSAET